MSVDDRLRSGLAANAQSFAPATEAALERTRRRGRRWPIPREVIAVLGAVAAVVVGLVLTGTLLHGTVPPGPAVSATSTGTSDLFGRYEADITSPQQLAGHWVIQLNGDGTADVTPPAGYAGVVSGALISANQTTLRLTLFDQDVCEGLGDGTYTWTRDGDQLVLSGTADPCTARSTFFTGNTWTFSP